MISSYKLQGNLVFRMLIAQEAMDIGLFELFKREIRFLDHGTVR